MVPRAGAELISFSEMKKPGASRAFFALVESGAYFETRSLESWVPIWLNTEAVWEADVIR